MRHNGRIDITATTLDALHHGAGTSGNTSLLRTQEIVLSDGAVGRVPFVSGNSLKHLVRDGAVRFALDAMAVGDGTLTKPVVDLLFSGGHLGKRGAAVPLDTARRIARMFPALSLCGYSAGNFMAASKVRCDNLHLLCVENAWRTPESFVGHPLLEKRAGACRGEEFGTRHEASRLPHVRARMKLEEKDATDKARAKAPTAKAGGSSQMIYDFETLKAGSVLWGAIYLEDLTDDELVALRSGLSAKCEGVGPDGGYVFRLGAKGSVGWGRVSLLFDGAMRRVSAPQFEAADLTPAIPTDDLAAYAERLRDTRDEVLDLLHEVAT